MENVKNEFFKETLSEGISKIYETQRKIASEKIYGRILRKSKGTLLREALSGENAGIKLTSKGVSATLSYPIYLRFIDMRHLGNLKIYNKILWGVLYKETFNKMRYNFREWLDKNIKEDLTKALNPK